MSKLFPNEVYELIHGKPEQAKHEDLGIVLQILGQVCVNVTQKQQR